MEVKLVGFAFFLQFLEMACICEEFIYLLLSAKFLHDLAITYDYSIAIIPSPVHRTGPSPQLIVLAIFSTFQYRGVVCTVRFVRKQFHNDACNRRTSLCQHSMLTVHPEWLLWLDYRAN